MADGSESTVDPQPLPWGRAFGRKPCNPQRMARAPILSHYALTAPPPRVDRRYIDFTPLLGKNDILPDCTAVTLFNCVLAAGWAINGDQQVVSEELAPEFYRRCLGVGPDVDLASTDGEQILDVLVHQRQHGCDVGQQQPLVADFGIIPSDDRSGIAQAVAKLGSCYIGVRLYQRDMDTIDALWDDDGAMPAGNLSGLHATFIWDYTGLGATDIVRIGTWGAWQSATWRWVARRIDEAHGATWPQMIPSEFDRQRLRAAVQGFVG